VTRTQSFKNGIILLALTTLSACTTSQTRFPEYSELVKKHSSIPVVVDLFVYRDIAGQSRGVNKQANSDYLDDVTAQVEELLSERGYSVNLLSALNGLTHKADKKAEYVISEDWKSTGEAYTQPNLDVAENPWRSSSNKQLLSSLLEVGKNINLAKDKDQIYAQNKVLEGSKDSDQKPQIAINEIEIEPSLFSGLESNIVLFIKVDGRIQKLSKYLAKGVPIGAVSYALTGGLMIVVPPGSFATAEAVVFDIKSRQVLWHSQDYKEGKNSVRNAVNFDKLREARKAKKK